MRRSFRRKNGCPTNGIGTFYTYLYYFDQLVKRSMLRISSDGLSFGAATEANTWKNDPRNTLMPDGKTWRRYQYDLRTTIMMSSVSTDGVNFTPESGIRYVPQPDDHGIIGVYDAFSDRSGGVVLLYIGDLFGRRSSAATTAPRSRSRGRGSSSPTSKRS